MHRYKHIYIASAVLKGQSIVHSILAYNKSVTVEARPTLLVRLLRRIVTVAANTIDECEVAVFHLVLYRRFLPASLTALLHVSTMSSPLEVPLECTDLGSSGRMVHALQTATPCSTESEPSWCSQHSVVAQC